MGIGKWNGVDIGRKRNGVWTQGSGMMCAYREVEWCGYREVEWCGDTEKGIGRGNREHREVEWCVDTGKWYGVWVQPEVEQCVHTGKLNGVEIQRRE